jgi:hypothetical protein
MQSVTADSSLMPVFVTTTTAASQREKKEHGKRSVRRRVRCIVPALLISFAGVMCGFLVSLALVMIDYSPLRNGATKHCSVASNQEDSVNVKSGVDNKAQTLSFHPTCFVVVVTVVKASVVTTDKLVVVPSSATNSTAVSVKAAAVATNKCSTFLSKEEPATVHEQVVFRTTIIFFVMEKDEITTPLVVVWYLYTVGTTRHLFHLHRVRDWPSPHTALRVCCEELCVERIEEDDEKKPQTRKSIQSRLTVINTHARFRAFQHFSEAVSGWPRAVLSSFVLCFGV